MRWTDDELRELIALWPTNSAKQIAIRMHRPRSAICSKAKRLRAEGLLLDGVHRHAAAGAEAQQAGNTRHGNKAGAT